MTGTLLGGVEGGGTKFVAVVGHTSGDSPPEVVDRLRIDTAAEPDATLGPIAEWLAAHPIEALGIATFGPLDLAAGTVRATPKPGWSGAPVRDSLTTAPIPTGFDTDVNGAGLGEWRWGAARGTSVALYLTVGTGIGGGVIVDGRPLHGLGHPEMGHIPVPRHPDDDVPSVCPLHVDCLEGMASGPALTARSHRPPEAIDPTDPVWDREAHYLAHGLATLTLVVSPEVVVVGGGVMRHIGLLDRVADHLDDVLDGYVDTPRLAAPAFGQDAGAIGALALAEQALV